MPVEYPPTTVNAVRRLVTDTLPSIGRLAGEISHSKFYHDLRHLAGRQLIMRCLSLAAVTYAMRQLGPAGVGELGYALATASVLALFANFGLEALLPKLMAESSSGEARNEIAGKLYSMRTITILCFTPFFVIGAFWQSHAHPNMGWPQLVGTTLIWLAAYLFLFGTALNPEAYKQGQDDLKKLGDFQLVSTIVSSTLYVVIFSLAPSAEAFLLIQAIALLLISWQAFGRGQTRLRLRPKIQLLREANLYIKAAWPTMVNIFVMFCFGGMDALFLPLLSTGEQVGLYGAATTLCNGVNAFVALIPLALYPRILAWVKASPTTAASRTVRLAIFLLAAAPFAYFASRLVCNWAVPLILGTEYRASGPVLAALIVQYLIYVGYYCITLMLVANGFYQRALLVSLSGAILGLLIYPLAAHFGGAFLVAHGKLAVYGIMVIVGLGVVARTRSELENKLRESL